MNKSIIRLFLSTLGATSIALGVTNANASKLNTGEATTNHPNKLLSDPIKLAVTRSPATQPRTTPGVSTHEDRLKRPPQQRSPKIYKKKRTVRH